MKKPQSIYWATLGAWLLGVIAHGICFVQDLQKQPRTEETYAHTFGFQVLVFLVTEFPYALAGLLVVLLAELVTLGRRA